MTTSAIAPQYVPAPLPPSVPPLLRDANAQHTTGSHPAYSDKQLLDLEMRKEFPDLWRAARAQSNEMKAEARKQAAESLDNEPKMVQQPRESQDRTEWIDHALPLFDPRTPGRLARAAAGTQRDGVPVDCSDRTFAEYQEVMESFAPLSYQLVGGGDPNTTCIEQLPEFIVCSDPYLENTFYDPFNWPKQILDYRNISSLWEESPNKGSCALWWKIDCPEPATTPEEINHQIDDALQTHVGTRTYLNQTQLDAYLDWRKANGTAKDFRFILVRDKPEQPSPATGVAVPPNSGSSTNGNGVVMAFFASVSALVLAIGGAGAMYLNRRCSPAQATPSTTTAIPGGQLGMGFAPTGASVHTASPSSMASASASISHTGAELQPAPSSATATPMHAVPASSGTSSSDDATGVGTSAVAIDIPPAGLEDDA